MMDTGYSLQYRALYEEHWWWRARERLILSTIKEIRSKGNSGSILDVGCGGGLLFDRLIEFGDVEGVEPNPSLTTEENRWKNRIYLCSFDDAFQPNKRYSLILMLDVLEHFRDPETCLRKAAQLLSPDGIILITVPAFSCLWTSHDDLNHHVSRYTKKSLAESTSRTGMRTLFCRYFFHWAFPVKLIIHYKEQCLESTPQLPRMPHRSVNQLLYWFCIAEQRIFSGIPLPFGSSLLALCSRQ